MKLLSPEEMAELRREIAGFSLSDERKDELIRCLDRIAVSFVDQAFGLHAVALSLSARANYAFHGTNSHGNLPMIGKAETVDLADNDDGKGAINKYDPESDGVRRIAPERK
jgi:hypothetical protein